MKERVFYYGGVTSSFVPSMPPPGVPAWLQLPGMIDQHGARRQLSKRLIGQIRGEMTRFSHKCRDSPLARDRKYGGGLVGVLSCIINQYRTWQGKVTLVKRA
jgi:hypothetical protein